MAPQDQTYIKDSKLIVAVSAQFPSSVPRRGYLFDFDLLAKRFNIKKMTKENAKKVKHLHLFKEQK